MLTETLIKDEPVIAYNPNAVPADERERWIENGMAVYAAVQEVHELPDGYSFRLPTDTGIILKVAEYLSNERLSCSFLRFTLVLEPDGGPFWMQLTGSTGVTEYMRAVFEMNSLLHEQVAKAAGFHSPNDD